jgi:hypothetical protein
MLLDKIAYGVGVGVDNFAPARPVFNAGQGIRHLR